jgi:hypothetical protein
MAPTWVSALEKVLKNIIFLSDVFSDRHDDEIPGVPILELAESFELASYKRAR